MNDTSRQQIWVMRHAETAWSLSGQHTGLTDIPLTAKGEKAASELKPWLSKMNFSTVLSSPLTSDDHSKTQWVGITGATRTPAFGVGLWCL